MMATEGIVRDDFRFHTSGLFYFRWRNHTSVIQNLVFLLQEALELTVETLQLEHFVSCVYILKSLPDIVFIM